MSRQCNGKGCNGAFDCDNCRQTEECNKTVICDDCGEELFDEYFEVDGSDLCENCILDRYRCSID